jgi:hypothetical protein
MHVKTNGWYLGLVLWIAAIFFTSCSRLGWGVLLWSTEDPVIPSGTVLPVYIRSNIDRVWVVGVPKEFRSEKQDIGKMEVPLAMFELAGSKAKAKKRAKEFAPYALTYAENIQDGLPIRDNPDNGARRVYRLRNGEIIKILAPADGSPAISATGDPLPGEWYKVLTADGSAGYCFSYRLRLFEHYGGTLAAAPAAEEKTADPDLDMVFSKVWSPELYSAMFNSHRINIDEFSKHYRFDPGQDTGVARIYLPGLDRHFAYSKLRSAGTRTWLFEGASLEMTLRSDTTLAVQFTENNGGMRNLLFVALPADIDDLIMQENNRRDGLYAAILKQGPAFTSNNYGTITFRENGGFSWSGFDLLVPHVIPENTAGTGGVSMNLFLDTALAERYNGAFTLRFSGAVAEVRFMYTLDNQGFRMEFIPAPNVEDITIMRRAALPTVLYFFKDDIF